MEESGGFVQAILTAILDEIRRSVASREMKEERSESVKTSLNLFSKYAAEIMADEVKRRRKH